MNKNSKIFVAGHRGMVGSAILRKLYKDGFKNIIIKNKNELNLTDEKQVESFFKSNSIDYVFLAAAKVGGILANNDYKADFFRDNINIQTNVIHYAYKYQVKKLLFLGSSCIYPRDCKQPIKEEYLLSGKLEPSNDAYAIAKISGIKMCEAYKLQHNFNTVCLMPTNLYGPNDNFDLLSSHVFAAFIRKFHDAKINNENKVECWGDGSPYREFLHVDDLAEACIHFIKEDNSGQIYNIGTGLDIKIKELAEKISKIIGYKGAIEWDISKPNGTPRKLLSVEKAESHGWKHKIDLESGIINTYKWFMEN
jgi:GDP-L-fucose synthase